MSERTIYRDIVELVSYGIPIESVAGRTGGFRLAGAAVAPAAAGLDLPAGQTHPGAGADRPERRMLVDPLGAAGPVGADGPGGAAGAVGAGGAGGSGAVRETRRAGGEAGWVAMLRRAMGAGLAVELTWRAEVGAAPVTVKPYGLVWRLGEWWLVGAASGRAPGRLRLGDVAGVRLTDLRFDHPADSFDLRAWWAGSAGRGESPGHLSPGRRNAGPRGRHIRMRPASQGSGS